MLKRHFIMLLLLGIFATAWSQTRPALDSLVFEEFYSKVLDENRRIIVHLPLNYKNEPDKKYPVTYVLDGGNQDVHTGDKIAILSAAGIIPECITIGILNTKTSRSRDQTPPFMRTEVDDPQSPYGNADRFLLFIESELIPKIDKEFRTSGYKTLTGHSRGGLFVLYTLLENHRLFDARFCYSTPVWRFNQIMVSKIEAFLSKQRFKKDMLLFISVGEAESDNIKNGHLELVKVLSKKHRKYFKTFTATTPFANHQQNPLLSTSKALYEWGKTLKPSKN